MLNGDILSFAHTFAEPKYWIKSEFELVISIAEKLGNHFSESCPIHPPQMRENLSTTSHVTSLQERSCDRQTLQDSPSGDHKDL